MLYGLWPLIFLLFFFFSSQCVLWCPLLLIPLNMPKMYLVSKELACMIWPKYESRCLVILPSSNIFVLTRSRIVLFVTFDVHGMRIIRPQHHSLGASFFPLLSVQLSHVYVEIWKTIISLFESLLQCWYLCSSQYLPFLESLQVQLFCWFSVSFSFFIVDCYVDCAVACCFHYLCFLDVKVQSHALAFFFESLNQIPQVLCTFRKQGRIVGMSKVVPLTNFHTNWWFVQITLSHDRFSVQIEQGWW